MTLGLPASGCGDDSDDESASEGKPRVVQRARTLRVRTGLEGVERKVPEATRRTNIITSSGQDSARTIDGFMTEAIQLIDSYWVSTFAQSRLAEPMVSYNWLPPGQQVQTGCVTPDGLPEMAGDFTMAYCPPDDTIYVGQVIAAQIYEGLAGELLPGERAGIGHGLGDFGVAHMIAHEYGHNVQIEAGYKNEQNVTLLPTKAFELHADCLAGNWANSAYFQGRLETGDVEEAISTVLATGDFDFQNAGHHGTPEERTAAWKVGYARGNPSDCNQFLQTG
jgi:predicted metalloprotease